jgi:glycosyltransferase involved in cell wall biosynthesis
MARYAGLVMEALGGVMGQKVEFERMHLRAPAFLTGLMGGRLQTWANHFWNVLKGPGLIRRRKADLVHILDGSFGYLSSATLGAPIVVTVHDLVPLLRQKGQFGPDHGSRLSRWLLGRVVRGLRRADWLLADSGNTALDLERDAGIQPGRVLVAPLAMSPSFRAAKGGDDSTSPNTDSPYLLHVGNNGYYKNREGVVRIFSQLPGGHEARLVMAGPAATRPLEALIDRLGLQSRVDFVIDPGDTELVRLYRGASLFLFPSLYEGFGWPPLEAMACGCPVVCSSAGSLPEVVGDAALTAPADDEEALSGHCIKVLADPELARSLAVRGMERVKQFTIERMREDLLTAYGRALESRTG